MLSCFVVFQTGDPNEVLNQIHSLEQEIRKQVKSHKRLLKILKQEKARLQDDDFLGAKVQSK